MKGPQMNEKKTDKNTLVKFFCVIFFGGPLRLGALRICSKFTTHRYATEADHLENLVMEPTIDRLLSVY